MTSAPVPSITHSSPTPGSDDEGPLERPSLAQTSPSSSFSSVNEDDAAINRIPTPARPGLGSRKSSGTMIVSRDTPNVEMSEEEYDEGDARCMSPKRSDDELERLEKGARESLVEQAKQLQASLLALVEQVERMRDEHEKLEGGNRFLQSYIGELMSTSRITSTGAPKAKKGKAAA